LLASLVLVGTGSGSLFAQATDQAVQPDTAKMEKYVRKVIVDAKWGNGPGEFGSPDPKVEDPRYHILMRVSPQEYLLITDCEGKQSRIQIFNNEGKYVRSQKCFSWGWLYDFDVDPKGNVYAIEDDGLRGIIRVYNPEGGVIGEFPQKTGAWLEDRELCNLTSGSIIRDSSNRVYAVVGLRSEDINILSADRYKKYVYVIEMGNTPVFTLCKPKDTKIFENVEPVDEKGYRWSLNSMGDKGEESVIIKTDKKGRVIFRMKVPVTTFNIQGRKWWLFDGYVIAFDKESNFYLLSPTSDGLTVFKYSPIVK